MTIKATASYLIIEVLPAIRQWIHLFCIPVMEEQLILIQHGIWLLNRSNSHINVYLILSHLIERRHCSSHIIQIFDLTGQTFVDAIQKFFNLCHVLSSFGIQGLTKSKFPCLGFFDERPLEFGCHADNWADAIAFWKVCDTDFKILLRWHKNAINLLHVISWNIEIFMWHIHKLFMWDPRVVCR